MKKLEPSVSESYDRAMQAKFDLSMEIQRLEWAVAHDVAKDEAVANLEAAAAASVGEARAAEQNVEQLLREADRVTPNPVRVAAVQAGLDAAYERVSALEQGLEDGIVAGKPDAALRRLSREQEEAAKKVRALEAESSSLAELTASADRLRSEASEQTATAAAARDRASRHRAEAAAVPEVARAMAIDAWKEEQRIAKLQPDRKPKQLPPVLVLDGQLMRDVNSGQVYDLAGRPI